MKIRIGNKFFMVEAEEGCTECHFFPTRANEDCPHLEDGGPLCKSIIVESGKAVFKKLPSFEEDIAALVESNIKLLPRDIKNQKLAVKSFLNEDNIQEILTIARLHDVL